MRFKAVFIVVLLLIISFTLTGISISSTYRKPARKPGEPRELTKLEQLRVEGYMNYFSYALFRYYCIHAEYPTSMNNLLQSGLIAYWPINPVTGKPVRIISSIRENDYQYAGDIYYEYDSPIRARFKGIFQTTRAPGWKFHEFPEIIDKKLFDQLIKQDPDSYTEKEPYRSTKTIVGLWGTLKDLRLDEKSGYLPVDLEQLFADDFRIIREYYRPSYTGKNPKDAGYFELGVDLQLGLWYSIYNIRPDFTYKFAHRFPYKSLSLTEREFNDQNFPDLENPRPLLSCFENPDFKSIPDKILISFDDIEYVRSRG